MKARRIGLLDSFRFLAIMSVILYHYTYCWDHFYPYGHFFKNLFLDANRGVQFFFIISGFVISYSLETTDSLSAFFKNRFIRLFPPMLLWSVIIYLTCTFWDNAFLFPPAHQPANFLPSLTFINPDLWNFVSPNTNFSWLDPAFWTLWVEVQFYLIAGLAFFIKKEKFLRNILLITLVLIPVSYIPAHFMQPQIFSGLSPLPASVVSFLHQTDQLFNLSNYICFFTLGVVFHHLYVSKSIKPFSFAGISIALIFCYQLYVCAFNTVRVMYLIMILLFLLMTYKKEWLGFLDVPIIRRVGAISYSVYLSHQTLGLLLINKYGGYLGKWSPLSVPIVMLLTICVSELSYRFIEQRMGRFLKAQLFRSKPVISSIETGHNYWHKPL